MNPTVGPTQRVLSTSAGGARPVSGRFGRFAARKLQFPQPTEFTLPLLPYAFLNPGGRIAVRQRGIAVG